MNYIHINGKCFESHTSNNHNVTPITGARHNEIFNHYKNPSAEKGAIWESWCKWCNEVNKRSQYLGF